jgi:hypothetical protein
MDAQHALVLMDEQLGATAEVVVDREFAQILTPSMPTSHAFTRASTMSTRRLTSISVTMLEVDDESHTLGKVSSDQPLAADIQKSNGKKSNIRRLECHRKGPTKAKCWIPEGGGKGGGPKKRENAEKDDKTEKRGNNAVADDDFEIAGWAAIQKLDEGDDWLPEIAAINENINESVPFDSGALPVRPMSPFRKSFVIDRPIDARPITAANNGVFHAIGMDDIVFDVPNGDTTSKFRLREVLQRAAFGSHCDHSHRICRSRSDSEGRLHTGKYSIRKERQARSRSGSDGGKMWTRRSQSERALGKQCRAH